MKRYTLKLLKAIYKVEPKTKFLVPTGFVHSCRESSALYLCLITKHVSLAFI